MSGPVCAKEDCVRPIIYRLAVDGRPLAYACSLAHLREVMYATRHIADGRDIGPIRGGAPVIREACNALPFLAAGVLLCALAMLVA